MIYSNPGTLFKSYSSDISKSTESISVNKIDRKRIPPQKMDGEISQRDGNDANKNRIRNLDRHDGIKGHLTPRDKPEDSPKRRSN